MIPKTPSDVRSSSGTIIAAHGSVKELTRTSVLSPSMTVTAFDNGYWYANELKQFARAIGVRPYGQLRKDELEKAIRRFLQTGGVGNPRRAVRSHPAGIRDVDRGLSLDLPVIVYTNDKQTRDFLEREAANLVPGYRRRSGARYRINRWREAQLGGGRRITYRDLVTEYVRLSGMSTFNRIPHGRYINFCAEFRASRPGATMAQAVAAWKTLKMLDAPKTYASWLKHNR